MRHSTGQKDRESRLLRQLREKGYKLTSQRLAIIHLLAGDTSHPSASDVLKRARKRVPKISMSTVYYALDMLKREGLIRELEFYEKENRYDINISDHINLVCRKCGKIEDFMGEVPLSPTEVEGKTGFRPEGMRFEFYGYCRACKNRGKR
ncbi:MAG: transcriptional repressor [Nitrospirae bacterium]|nr:transcriptional repressor [Nitrospirota bacterium]